MRDFAEKPRTVFDTMADMCEAEGFVESATLLRSCEPSIDIVERDNWNGGTYRWAVRLRIDPFELVRIRPKRDSLISEMTPQFQEILAGYPDDSFFIEILPSISEPSVRSTNISAAVRAEVLDYLRHSGVNWSGAIGDLAFLKQLFPLQSMPSFDTRYQTAEDDIWQHTVNNPSDWDRDWIYSDSRFDLLRTDNDTFIKFLVAIAHPSVRPDRNEAAEIVVNLNETLRISGWRLVQSAQGRGFVAQRLSLGDSRASARVRAAATALDSSKLRQEIERIERSIDIDPALAIGTAKELVESCCKSILTIRRVEYPSNADLPQLTKLLLKELDLVPEGISDKSKGAESIRLLLRNLSAITQYLAELRSLYGTGHGRDGNHRGLQPRHARLAVGMAVTFVDFITETHLQRALAVQPPTSTT
jgi:hypothetical protein